MKFFRLILLLFLITAWLGKTYAQTDTSIFRANSVAQISRDSIQKNTPDSLIKKHDPRKATRRSALIPGWGQAYNREYWKIPLVYGALAIPAGLFIYNNNWYKKTKYAYEAKYNAEVNGDTTGLAAIDPQLKGLSTSSLQSYRNSFRRDRDYSILFFLLAWGLNVVDATVFGHLKDFDVSNDLSMNVKPNFNPTTRTPGLSLTFSPKKPVHKLYEVR
jgi:Family of unknown function (DUF5683)